MRIKLTSKNTSFPSKNLGDFGSQKKRSLSLIFLNFSRIIFINKNSRMKAFLKEAKKELGRNWERIF